MAHELEIHHNAMSLPASGSSHDAEYAAHNEIATNLDRNPVAPFMEISSVQDCLAKLAAAGFLDKESGAISAPAADRIVSICAALRHLQLEMEPNILGRVTCDTIFAASVAGRFCVRFTKSDTDVAPLIAEADRARDDADFRRGERLYTQALGLFTRHPVLHVQLAHCLKEQGKLEESLLHYYDALACGAPLSDVFEHAVFVADRLALGDIVRSSLALNLTPLLSDEVADVHELFLGEPPTTKALVHCAWHFPTIEALCEYFVTHHAFHESNRRLLLLVSETRWGQSDD